MALMFLCLAVLEDSGYMARAAVVADRLISARRSNIYVCLRLAQT